MKKASKGSSGKMANGSFEPISLSKAHKSGKTAETFNAKRIDKLERMKPVGSGGVKK